MIREGKVGGLVLMKFEVDIIMLFSTGWIIGNLIWKFYWLIGFCIFFKRIWELFVLNELFLNNWFVFVYLRLYYVLYMNVR